MKKLLSIFSAFGVMASSSFGVVACNHEKENQYLLNCKKTFVNSDVVKKAKTLYDSISSTYISTAIISNIVVDVDAKEIADVNNNGTLSDDTKDKILDEFSTNLYLFDVVKENEVLNPADFNVSFKAKATETDAGYYNSGHNDFWKITIQSKSDAQNAIDVIVTPIDFQFTAYTKLTEKNFTNFISDINSDGLIASYAEMGMTYNGARTSNNTWDGEQKISLDEALSKNTAYLSSHLQGIGLINEGTELNGDSFISELDVKYGDIDGDPNTFDSIEKTITIERNGTLSFNEDKKQDWANHTVVETLSLRMTKGSANKLDVLGAFIDNQSKY